VDAHASCNRRTKQPTPYTRNVEACFGNPCVGRANPEDGGISVRKDRRGLDAPYKASNRQRERIPDEHNTREPKQIPRTSLTDHHAHALPAREPARPNLALPAINHLSIVYPNDSGKRILSGTRELQGIRYPCRPQRR
jgi:hypothetical protein